MKILVATDAWFRQVNAVFATYQRPAEELPALGIELTSFSPEPFATVAMPGYRENSVENIEAFLSADRPGLKNDLIESRRRNRIRMTRPCMLSH